MKYIGILIIAMLLLASALAMAEENLILNSGFEQKKSLVLDETERYWTEDDDADYWEEVSWGGKRSNLYSRSGQWSLNSWGGDSTEKHGAWQGDDNREDENTNFISIKPGTLVRFTAYLMSPDGARIGRSSLAGGAEAFIEIEWGGDGFVESVESVHLSKTTRGEWKLFSVSGIAPAGTKVARFICKVSCIPGSGGDIYFDDLKAIIVSGQPL